MLRGAKCKIDWRRAQRSCCDALIFRKRSWSIGLKDKFLFLGHLCESGLGNSKILRYHIRRGVGHPVREEHGLVLGEVAVVEDQQEFGAVRRQTLNRVGNSGREVPEVTFFYI